MALSPGHALQGPRAPSELLWRGRESVSAQTGYSAWPSRRAVPDSSNNNKNNNNSNNNDNNNSNKRGTHVLAAGRWLLCAGLSSLGLRRSRQLLFRPRARPGRPVLVQRRSSLNNFNNNNNNNTNTQRNAQTKQQENTSNNNKNNEKFGGPEIAEIADLRRALSSAAAQFEFRERSPRTVGTWAGQEERGLVEKSGRAHMGNNNDNRNNSNNGNSQEATSCVYRLPAFLPLEQAAKLLDYLKGVDTYEVKADSVDKMPSFEYYPFKDGEWKDVGLRALLGTFVDESVLPYVRARYSREEQGALSSFCTQDK
ncbi:unnamed protein product [Polarella glacialis]|uniref:Uncharacterized protein n=1 Tax=Polarella glacialis TaxID=89957 RepID=A0A813JA30_POLGL|nr:unnamed protein product [Polarella glacialis]